MGFLEDSLNLQDGKRSQRLSRESRKAKIDSNKIKEGTYRGIDLVDGTARIQLDGQSTMTSGYRLITNAPLGDGDRVSIRPNGVGLPRADARNVAQNANEEKPQDLYVALLGLVEIITSNGIDDFTLLSRSNIPSLMEYEYVKDRSKNLKFTKKRPFNINANTLLPFPENPSAIYEIDFTGGNNFVTFTPAIAGNQFFFGIFEVYFDADTWGKTFEPWVGRYNGADFFTAPIEIDIKLNGGGEFRSLIVGKTLDEAYYFISSDIQLRSSGTARFEFRFRKRGASRWFQL